MSKWIVVSRYKEPDMSWLEKVDHLEWSIMVDDKGTYEEDNHPGREASTYLQWIVDHYDRVAGDEIIFCQADPFNHCPTFLSDIHNPKINYFGEVMKCDQHGYPACDFTPLHSWSDVFDLPKLTEYKFVAGAQYRVFDEQILAHSKDFWQALLSLTKVRAEHNMSAYVMERLWPLLLGIELL
jgi:hypothetical protein